ncbi:MAG: ribulose-phosphate 3-epimerase [Chloroflexota bacterium]
MNPDYLIAPSILSADFAILGEQIREAEAAGADWIHIDVMDGHFAPNLTMGPAVVAACRRTTDLPLDVHLMVTHPENFVQSFAQAGADSLTVHVEIDSDVRTVIDSIKAEGCNAGLAYNPDTPVEELDELIDLLDLVLIMTVSPGFSGQAFMKAALPKVSQVRELIDNKKLPINIQVDGGIDAKTLPIAKAAGANVFVAGSAIFDHTEGISAGIKALKKVLTTQ